MIGRVHFGRSMRVFSLQVLQSLVFLGMLSTLTLAQSPSGSSAALSFPPLRRGTNEFGIWSGYSPFSFVFKGTSKDRQLFLFNLQYARTLLATPALILKYTAELVPVALEFQPTQRYQVNGKLLINPGGTIYGGGANPLGVQGNFGHRKIQPFATGSLGFLYFKQQVPVLGSSQFNYNITMGFGAQFFPRSGCSLIAGWKYHHLSNNYQARFNPGLDSGLFYLGFSIFRARK